MLCPSLCLSWAIAEGMIHTRMHLAADSTKGKNWDGRLTARGRSMCTRRGPLPIAEKWQWGAMPTSPPTSWGPYIGNTSRKRRQPTLALARYALPKPWAGLAPCPAHLLHICRTAQTSQECAVHRSVGTTYTHLRAHTHTHTESYQQGRQGRYVCMRPAGSYIGRCVKYVHPFFALHTEAATPVGVCL